MKIKTIIETIRGISGTNDTIAMMTKHSTNTTLKEFFRLALDTRIKFHIKQIPEYTFSGTATLTLDDAMDGLSALSSRELTGNAAREYLSRLLGSLDPDDAEMLELVVTGKIDCGITKKTANKVYGSKFIRDKAYMRCDLSTPENMENMPFPAILQKKMDGQYSDHFTDSDKEIYCTESRSGIEYDFLGSLDDYFLALSALIEENNPDIKSPVFQGELLTQDSNGNIQPRNVSNGIVGKATIDNVTITKEEADTVIAVLWDVLPKEKHDEGLWNKSYIDRLTALQEAVDELADNRIRVVDYAIVSSEDEAFRINAKWQQEGEEGSILKKTTAIWKSGTSKEQLKMKVCFASDYKAVGIEEGTGKFKGSMGAIIFESSDGKIRGKVGSGWKHACTDPSLKEFDRQYIWDNWDSLFKGRILTICANDITKAKGSDFFALSHPSIRPLVGGWRDSADKSEADDYEKCSKELESAKYVKKEQKGT